MTERVVIQIPCFNEAAVLQETLADIQEACQHLPQCQIVVIDDGSDDATSEVAESHGADVVVRHRSNRGLAEAFRTGIETAMRLGADVIVNTDADNQYSADSIADLIAPILTGRADIVVGDRQTNTIAHFSRSKRFLQKFGSWVVRRASGLRVNDAVSGFRAFSREAAGKLNNVTSFSHTIETLVYAGHLRMAVESVPVETNLPTRPSQLFRSVPQFVGRSLATLLRSWLLLHPLRVCLTVAVVLMAIGIMPVVRFLYLFSINGSAGHIQSLVLGSVFIMFAGMAALLGLVADLAAVNRQLLERILSRQRDLSGCEDPESFLPSELEVDRCELPEPAP